MMIVDSQIHLWTDGRMVDSSNAHHRQQTVFSASDLLPEMDEAGVSRAILVPPMWTNNNHAIEAARNHPDRFGVMGRLPVADPASRSLIAGWRERTGMLGIRLVFNAEHKHLLLEGEADWVWPAAEREGLPVMVLAPGLLHLVEDIAIKHPSLRLIIDHFAVHSRMAKGISAFTHLPQLLALAKYPNIAVKASGFPGYSAEAYPFRDMHEPIRQAIDAFGPHRVFWGTDLTRMPCPYRQCITFITEEADWMSDQDKTLFMGQGLCDWIGWSY